MFNRLKNRVLSAVSPDMPALPVATSSLTGSGGHNHQHHHHHHGSSRHNQNPHNLPDKFAYQRPPFLQLCTPDELRASADHAVRPIIVPRDVAVMPWQTGYAECVNSGKSEWNEDQCAFQRHVLVHPQRAQELPYIYFGTFDGHAGYGAALAASHQFHHILHEKLVDVIDMLMPVEVAGEEKRSGGQKVLMPHPHTLFQRSVSRDELIIGALESAFAEMDALLAEDRDKYRNAGGCTALATLFIDGKMFVANAGDSRAVLCRRKVLHRPGFRPIGIHEHTNGNDNDTQAATTTHNGHHNHHNGIRDHYEANVSANAGGDDTADMDNTDVNHIVDPETGRQMRIYATPFSYDHTPDTERPRLLSSARLNPSLMGSDYVAMEYGKRPQSKDLGTRILYRQGQMRGWAYKTLMPDDLRMPLVTGEGKRSRLLGTIGVTRGFGDHDLRALYTQVPIKPFLSSAPEVRVLDLSAVVSLPSDANADGEYGVLVMATDGLWDVSESEAVARTVFQTLARFPAERHRYTMCAQELVARARGKINESGHWRLAETKAAATVDDISVLAIPVYQYYVEWSRWERECAERRSGEATARRVSVAEEAEGTTLTSVDDVEVGLANGMLRMGETADGEETIAVELMAQDEAAGTEVMDSEVNAEDEDVLTTTAADDKPQAEINNDNGGVQNV